MPLRSPQGKLYETREMLAGAYRGGQMERRMVSHFCVVDSPAEPLHTVCGRVKGERMCDVGHRLGDPSLTEPPTCPACLKKYERLRPTLEVIEEYEVKEPAMNRNPKRGDFPAHVQPIELEARELKNGDSIRYGDFKAARGVDLSEDQWGEVEYATGSDYSGGSVTKANHKELSEMLMKAHPEGTPLVWLASHGGHGTYALLVRYFQLDPEIREVLDGLEDYPAVSDEAVSEVEHERENEAWEGWGQSDFQKAFLEAWNANWSGEPGVEDWPDAVTADMTYGMFHVGKQLANENWIHEQGDSVFIDMEPIVDNLTELLAGGRVPSWLSPDDFSDMLKVSEAFGMQVVKSELVGRRGLPATTKEREARGQQRLPHVKNAQKRRQWQVWSETDGKEKVLARGGEAAMKVYYKQHGGERAGLHVGYEFGFVGTLRQFAEAVGTAEVDADVAELKQLSGYTPDAGSPLSEAERKYWVLLQLLAKAKAQAIPFRLSGRIDRATHFEREADSIYKQLPAHLKW